MKSIANTIAAYPNSISKIGNLTPDTKKLEMALEVIRASKASKVTVGTAKVHATCYKSAIHEFNKTSDTFFLESAARHLKSLFNIAKLVSC